MTKADCLQLGALATAPVQRLRREYKGRRVSLLDVTNERPNQPLLCGAPQWPVVVGVTGASGMPYAVDLLATLRQLDVRTVLVVSNGAKQVLATELERGLEALTELADVVEKDNDLGAAIASGSHRTAGMVIVPCSAGTLAKVAHGHADTLITRAAHVTIKERRPLVLVVREAPYSRPLLVNMLAAHDGGAVVLPAAPGFYNLPDTITELVAGITSRALDLLGIDNDRAPRWRGGS